MAQAGRMVICGDAGDALGDSLYEAVHLRARQDAKSLGADAQLEPMTDADLATSPNCSAERAWTRPERFKRIASARSLYHWNADANQEY
jgi:hypothetical protein